MRPLARLLELIRRLRGQGSPTADGDLDDEVRFHIQMQSEQYVRSGMPADEALRRARTEFGALERFKEECREQRRGSQLDMLLQDIGYALRVLRKNPGFTAAAVLTLALGIGANTAIFSVVYGVLLRPLPYRDGEQLVLLRQSAPGVGRDDVPFAIRELYDLREQATSFDGLVEFHQMFFVLLGRGEPERVETGVVSANFFDVLGVPPLHGRTFVDTDDDLDADAVLVLSHGYWQRAFGSDPGVVGQVFEMNNRPHTVVGVLPPIPQYPQEVDVFMPTSACPFRASGERRMHENRRAFAGLTVFGRLTPGATAESAAAEIRGVADRFRADYPDVYLDEYAYTATALDLKNELTQGARPMLLMLLATAGVVLLIACTNVANLTLARVMRREQEIALRAALGAGRGRILRQLMTESLVLSITGGLAGLAFAWISLDLLRDFALRFTPRAIDLSIDGWVLAFTFLVAVGTGLLFGTVPGLPGLADLSRAIKEGGRGQAPGGRQALRRGLVVAQVALSFVLLIGAGLTLRSLAQLRNVDPGFDVEHVLSAQVSLNWSSYEDLQSAHRYLEELVDTLASSPFARAAALTSKPPYRSNEPVWSAFFIDGRAAEDTESAPQVDLNFVAGSYFEVLGVPIIEGRAFDSRDFGDAAPVAMINETLARQFWPDSSPVGARVSFDRETWITIVGVAADTRVYGPEVAVTAELYQPVTQSGFANWLLVRTTGDPANAVEELKAVAYAMDGKSPITDLAPMATLRDDAVASPRLTAMLLGLFAVLALVVTVTGVAGVMAFTVNQRTREMGLRMALGAQRGTILGMVVRQGMLLVMAGVAAGVLGALVFGRAIAGMLHDVAPTDAVTFVLVTLCLGAASLLAVLVPARRAVAVDPVVALRQD